jgi:serine/threonine-protein kinase
MSDLERFLFAHLADRYRGEGLLGTGGMAFVYRGHDLRHDRKVAVKVLRPELAAVVGAERFLQEIRVTANLQHPHILPLYDSGSVEGLVYYVMPLVAGESLRSRLTRERQLPVGETVELLRAAASALDYAHRHRVIHRDVKPENILLHDGQPLVADFGIALAVSAAAGPRITQTGMSIGTPQYMSPEQASAEPVDGRTDIYALGCIGYEMLAGVPPHHGPNAQAVLASTLTSSPRPIAQLRRSVSEPVAAAIHRALERLPADRFTTALEFAEALTAGREGRKPARHWQSSRLGPAIAAAALTLAVGIGLGRSCRAGDTTAAPIRRWNLVLPERAPIALTGPGPLGAWQSALALSPDGELLAYVAPEETTTRLYLRRLDQDSSLAVPGTEGAYHPFFSTDGRWIGFFSGTELKKVQVGGVSPILLTQVNRPVGAVWSSQDRILLLENDGFGMRWVPGAGGASDSTIVLGTQFGTPDLLPGERWAVGQLSSGQLALLSTESAIQLVVTRRGVVPFDAVGPGDLLIGTSPRYVRETKHLVFAAGDGVLMALPFDGDDRRVLGEPVPVVSQVRIEEGFSYAEFAISVGGTLAYVPGGHQNFGRLALVNRDGTIDTLPFPRGRYTQLRLSPDGTKLAVQDRPDEVGGWNVSILDLVTGQRRRMEVEGNYRSFPASWSPDGATLMVGIWDPVQFLQYGARMYPIDGGPYRTIEMRGGASYLTIAPNGKDFVYSDWRTGALFVRPLWDTVVTPIPGRGFAASFSPDGKWLAWGDVNGSVAVSPLPPTGSVFIAAERGQQPLWSPRGDRLIFRDGRRFYQVTVATGSGGLQTGRPEMLAEGPFVRTFAWNHSIGPDGRIAVLLAHPERSRRDLGFITGFHRVLATAAPATR